MRKPNTEAGYLINLLDQDGNVLIERYADTMIQARKLATYIASPQWADSNQTTHDELGSAKVEVLRNGVCMWDKEVL